MTDEVIELILTDIANGGQSIGKHDGKTIFVPYTLPGETVNVKIVDDRGRYAFAEGISVVDVSADRILPKCPHFGPGKCRQCRWQHIDYPAQLALKTDIVIDQLARVGKFHDVDVQMTIGSPEIWYYGHQAEFRPAPDGKFGYLATDGQTVLPVEACHVVVPDILDLLEQFDFDLKTLTRVKIVTNRQDDRMVVLSVEDDEAPSLEVDFKASVNFLLSDDVAVNLIGATHLVYQLLGQPYRVTAGCFMRNNLMQIETLMQLLVDWLDLDGTENILDVYAGSGMIAGALAPHASLITCIESYAAAMTDAEENLKAFDHIDLIEGDAADVLPNLTDQYDIAIVDPPQAGLSKAVVDALTQPKRLVYIGDDPATLARDVRRLVDHNGYELKVVQPIDFEPQTHTVVTVAYLVKGT